MPSAKLNAQALQEICQRNLKLYSGAIADILDKGGHRKQVLPRYLTPMTTVNRLAGLAFTGQGYPCASTADDDTQTRLNMLDSITPGTVSVWACGGSVNCAHWGEMMSTAARQRGCTGGVLDGGVRDLDFINVMQYPVFAAFQCAASSIGRWNIKELGGRLARQRNALALALERGAHHALVVAALVDAGGIEIGDADVGGALDHAGVGSDHATEAHAGDFQAGLAERAVAQSRGGYRGGQGSVMLLVVRGRAGGRCRGGHGQSGKQEIAAG